MQTLHHLTATRANLAHMHRVWKAPTARLKTTKFFTNSLFFSLEHFVRHTCPDATRSTSSSTTATIVNSSLRTFRRRRRLADLRSPIGCATIQDDDDDDDDDGGEFIFVTFGLL
ncbi:uncharacterized protein LOC111249774 [Varroa destructor]|uniref:Uncharacterized protein n=1 Tax=Varroa destructor TaxID=109461 RepID=A0A7M7K0A0_VARDE|nr:uncharacterized protein LOC111249774 [Varroa destructor]